MDDDVEEKYHSPDMISSIAGLQTDLKYVKMAV